MINSLIPHRWPADYLHSPLFTLRVNGQPVECLAMNVAHYASFEFTGTVEVELTATVPLQSLEIKPLSRKIAGQVDGNRVVFTLSKPEHLCIEAAGLPSFFLYALPPEANTPDLTAPGVRTFAPGQIHEAGEIILESGQTLYIPAGAVVHGVVVSTNTENVRICGYGILDGTAFRASKGWGRMIRFEKCRNFQINDLLVSNTCGWTITTLHCQHVSITGFRLLGEMIGGDGIDIVASQHVRVDNCCIRANDDCLVVKAFDINWRKLVPSRVPHTDLPVEDVVFTRCVLWNDRAGNAIEIGHELINKDIHNVIFRDIDVLCVHGHGAAFSINNAGHSSVHDILFEDIRVDHYYEFLLAFRIRESRWSHGAGRGHIHDITLRNIKVNEGVFNPGYSISVIGGWSPEHKVERVTIENLTFNDRKILDYDTMDLYVKHASDIVLK
ncbi:MAG: glycosyl hydrolase family 28 protein [Verrucomicrobiota bacterium]|nr:glycosyl hydrolase family 28 protein [Verrucomicrobiota bacterium]